MSRLIDADALGVGRCSKDILPAAYCAGWNGLIELIEKAPTIDAVPVVRCRECVNCLIDNTERKYHLCMRHSSVFPRKVDLMDFCSYGERKEGADNG